MEKPIIIKKCIQCGKEFETRSPKAKYCSAVCRGKYERETKFGKKIKKCQVCGKEFETTDNRVKYCSDKCKKLSKQKEHIMKRIVCPQCGKEFETNSGVKKFCSKECAEIYESKIKYQDTDAVTCKICGFMGMDITRHILSSHHLSLDEYCKKYNVNRKDLISESNRQKRVENNKKLIAEGKLNVFSTDNNPSNGEECKNGRNSPYSVNFRGYDNLTDAEKELKINELKKIANNNMNNNCNNPLHLDYYIKRGMTKTEAEKALIDRQTTFTLEKCIQKYGEEEGTKRYRERQEKWNKNFKKNNFSKISQKLFWKIYNLLNKETNDEIYFATLNPKTKLLDETGKNYEYVLSLKTTSVKPDFIILNKKKIIEFDGDYWHSIKRGNQLRDAERDKLIKECGFNILHISEREFNENEEEAVQKCIKYLIGE